METTEEVVEEEEAQTAASQAMWLICEVVAVAEAEELLELQQDRETRED